MRIKQYIFINLGIVMYGMDNSMRNTYKLSNVSQISIADNENYNIWKNVGSIPHKFNQEQLISLIQYTIQSDKQVKMDCLTVFQLIKDDKLIGYALNAVVKNKQLKEDILSLSTLLLKINPQLLKAQEYLFTIDFSEIEINIKSQCKYSDLKSFLKNTNLTDEYKSCIKRLINSKDQVSKNLQLEVNPKPQGIKINELILSFIIRTIYNFYRKLKLNNQPFVMMTKAIFGTSGQFINFVINRNNKENITDINIEYIDQAKYMQINEQFLEQSILQTSQRYFNEKVNKCILNINNKKSLDIINKTKQSESNIIKNDEIQDRSNKEHDTKNKSILSQDIKETSILSQGTKNKSMLFRGMQEKSILSQGLRDSSILSQGTKDESILSKEISVKKPEEDNHNMYWDVIIYLICIALEKQEEFNQIIKLHTITRHQYILEYLNNDRKIQIFFSRIVKQEINTTQKLKSIEIFEDTPIFVYNVHLRNSTKHRESKSILDSKLFLYFLHFMLYLEQTIGKKLDQVNIDYFLVHINVMEYQDSRLSITLNKENDKKLYICHRNPEVKHNDFIDSVKQYTRYIPKEYIVEWLK